MATDKKLIRARREVERLRLEAGGATEADIEIWRAECRVRDLERAERQAAAAGARRAALGMDLALFAVAALVMAFSLGNIRGFALQHGIEDPIAAFIAPAIDLALVAALIGDAVLSRVGLDAGPWATRLRYVSGVLTLVLNSWEAGAALDVAGLLLHAGMPVLLFVLAEAASPYRRAFAESVRLAGQDTVSTPEPEPVSTPVDTEPEPEPAEVDETEPAPAVSTMTPQVAEPTPIRPVPDPEPVSTPAEDEVSTPGKRLDTAAAKKAIEDAWADGLTVREAAARATRATSYVGTVYARLTRERGPQPIKGQTRIEGDAA